MIPSFNALRATLAAAFAVAAIGCSGVGPFSVVPNGTLVVTPGNPTLDALGSSVQLQIASVDVDGAQTQITWTSSNPSVATVDGSGVATAMGDGTATITARVGDLTGTTTITVAATILHTARITGLDQADANTLNDTAAAAVTVQTN